MKKMVNENIAPRVPDPLSMIAKHASGLMRHTRARAYLRVLDLLLAQLSVARQLAHVDVETFEAL